jgi:uncharacterized protein
MSQTEVINIIKSYIKKLIDSGIPVQKVYLYGSYARNEANVDSDIDVMLISDYFNNASDEDLSKPWLYSTQFNPKIEPYSVGMKRFISDDVSPLLEIVRREGIEILI